jgi:hypothetical protein
MNNDDLREWDETISEGERLLSDMRARAIRMRHGLLRRALMALIRFTERWVARGKRWRSKAMRGG